MKTLFHIMTVLCVALFSISCRAQKHTSTFQDNVDESEIFFEPEQQPYYLNGGSQGMLSDLYTAISRTAPEANDSVKRRAAVSFKITKKGMIDPNSIKVIRNRSVPDDYMNAAIEAIKGLGKFEPGKMNGTPKTVTYSLPILYPVPTDMVKTGE
ncbi:MAG: energy transducer TonB [[Clostridium] fimetarium]|nr:energy transducer TonB [Alistipes timonensis]MCM1405765.1 energy transducer TonB [[Clostridium] fimetarium]